MAASPHCFSRNHTEDPEDVCGDMEDSTLHFVMPRLIGAPAIVAMTSWAADLFWQ